MKPDLDLFEEALDYDRFCESFDRQPGEASGGWSLLGLLAVAAVVVLLLLLLIR